jgi:hypothetical protein
MEELRFEVIEFLVGDSSYFRPVGVIEISIIEELGGRHNSGQEKSSLIGNDETHKV